MLIGLEKLREPNNCSSRVFARAERISKLLETPPPPNQGIESIEYALRGLISEIRFLKRQLPEPDWNSRSEHLIEIINDGINQVQELYSSSASERLRNFHERCEIENSTKSFEK